MPWSNPERREEYLKRVERGDHWMNQCFDCRFFQALDLGCGVCQCDASPCFQETLFEHFGCD